MPVVGVFLPPRAVRSAFAVRGRASQSAIVPLVRFRIGVDMAASSSHISIRKIDGISRIDFVDRNILDEVNIQQISVELMKVIESEFRPKMVVVFNNVDHLSSAAFGVFVALKNRMDSRDGQLRLCEIKPRIREAFAITKLDRIFSIHDSFDAAVKSLN
jgi:anti-sigma B factor antagonist